MRVLCVWLPNWPIQQLRLSQPEFRHRPLLIFAEAQRGQNVVIACCSQAHEQGIRPGVSLSEAQTLCVDSGTSQHDPDSDRMLLRRLAWACDRFTPVVGLEEVEHPECLLLDITGSEPLFRGEANLVDELHRQMTQFSLNVRIGVAFTVGLAWAVAHSRWAEHSPALVTPDNQGSLVARLPIETLRLPDSILAKLRSLDLRTVGQLLRLPRSSLPSRFGKELLTRLDQLQGLQAETITPERRPEPIERMWETESPLRHQEALETIVRSLLESVREILQARGDGFQRLTCELIDPAGSRTDLTLELLRPTTDVDHVLELFRLQWERLSFGEGLSRIHIRSQLAMPLAVQQRSLFGGDTQIETEQEFALLLERMSSRLGRHAVIRPRLRAEPVPEHSVEWVSCLEASSVQLSNAGDGEPLIHCLRRPFWLKQTPIAIDVLSVVPDGPPYQLQWDKKTHRIVHAWGPERITAGWWNRGHVRRDYYHIETEEGRRFWLFRDLGDHAWFLHAEFD